MKAIEKELQKKAMFALKEYKEEHQFTQEDLARKMGVTRVTISMWLIGKQNFSGIAIELLKAKGIL